MVLTVSFALFPVTGLSCHRRQRDAKHHRRLDASVGASEPHDFAVRRNAARLAPPPRPSHPAPTFVTTAKRPSARGGTAESIMLILANGEAKYFLARGWTGICKGRPSGKSLRIDCSGGGTVRPLSPCPLPPDSQISAERGDQ